MKKEIFDKTYGDWCKTFSKSSSKCEAIGEIDELISLLGIIKALIKCYTSSLEGNLWINHIQEDLFIVNSELATNKIKVDSVMLYNIELKCTIAKDNLEEMPKDFVIPGKSILSAHLDYARTVTRRCERRIVKLYEQREIKNKFLLNWINRLSYYLWLLARKEEEKCH